MSDFAITVSNLSKHFRLYHDRTVTLRDRVLLRGATKWTEFQALRGVSLTIPKGQAVGFVGQNGSGKSTLLKLIGRILFPDEGTVEHQGTVSTLLELGAGFEPDFTGHENIYMNASIFGLSRAEVDRVYDQIVAFSELGDFIHSPVRTYSSGMYMRLAFSVAVHVGADILLIDEILAVGDAAFQRKCFDKILELKQAGRTIVIVSHEHNSIKRLCDRVVWLRNGEVAADGDPESVVEFYLDDLMGRRAAAGKQEAAPPSASPHRSGSQEGRITRVRLMNGRGEERTTYTPGESMDVLLDYAVDCKLRDPVVAIGVFLPDGTRCYETNTWIDRVGELDLPPGSTGTIRFHIDRLDLINGQYFLSLALQSSDGYTYDRHNRMYSFTVISSLQDMGISRPQHSWVIGNQQQLGGEEWSRSSSQVKSRP